MAQLVLWRSVAMLVSRMAPHIGAGAHGLWSARSAYLVRHCSISRPNDPVGTGAAGSSGSGSSSGSGGSSGADLAADDSATGTVGNTSKTERRSGTADTKLERSTGNPPRNTSWAASSRTADIIRKTERGNAGPVAGAAKKHEVDAGSPWQRHPRRFKQGRNVQNITTDITGCTTLHQLQRTVQQDGQHMNYINLSAAISKLHKILSNSSPQQQRAQQGQAESLLGQLWKLQQPKLSEYDARGLSNMIYSVCLLPRPLQQQYQWVLAQHLLPAFVSQVSSANPQDISNVVYGLADSGQQMPQHKTQMLVDQLVAVLPDASIQSIANTVWAVATMSQQIQPLQLQQLMDAFRANAHQTKPQDISNTLWAVATMQQRIQPTQLQQLLDAFCVGAQKAKPQEIANTLWAVATMQQQVQPSQLQQLLDAFGAVAQKEQPQEIANTLWAVAKMQQKVEQRQLDQLIGTLVMLLSKVVPQDVANTLWAVATMQQVVKQGQLEQLLGALVMQLGDAVPQAVPNTLLACAEFRYLPKQLLTAPALFDKLAAANPQALANAAWACGQLGYRDEQLMSALLDCFVDLVGNCKKHLISSGVVVQELANLCWSLAVLDMRQHVPSALTLVQVGKPLWASMRSEDLRQLYQVHMWMTDHSLAGGQGLAAVLTTQQLQQCQSTWHQLLRTTAKVKLGSFHQSVFRTLQRIPIKWLEPPAKEQISLGSDGQPDGAALIDITARTADGVWLAIEADGPWHFRRPDRGLMGTTLYRNRALAVRGYVLISVPYYQWDTIRPSDRQQYMLDKVTIALKTAAADKAASSSPAA